MNHRNTTLAIAAIIAAAALTGVAFAIPQQVMAGGYYGHRHHNDNNRNGIRVDQQVNQLNSCSTGPSSQPQPPDNTKAQSLMGSDGGSGGSTTCLNIGANSADIHSGMHR